MLSELVRSQIKHIKIFTKKLVSSSLSGDYISAFKGSGMEFHQIREYQHGDDVRFLDWNSSAKSRNLMVKQFIEERDRTIILMVDISFSANYSSKLELKKELIATITSVLTFISSDNNDKVGAIFFSDKVEKWVPPSRGMVHANNILNIILTIEASSKGTNIDEALRFLINLKKHNFVVFMLSDFIDDIEKFKKILKVVSYKHDFIGMRILDNVEKELPSIGLLEVEDPETGEHLVLDTNKIQPFLNEHFNDLSKLFDKYKIDLLNLTTDKPFTSDLIKFFHKRIRRSI